MENENHTSQHLLKAETSSPIYLYWKLATLQKLWTSLAPSYLMETELI